MRKITIALTLTLTLLSLTSSATFALPIEKANFWTAEKDGKKIYILGTIHYGVSMNDLPPYILEIFGQTQAIFLESDAEKLMEEVFTDDRNLFLLPEGQSLRAIISEDAYKRLAAILQKVADGLEVKLDRLTPWAANLIYSGLFEEVFKEPEFKKAFKFNFADIKLQKDLFTANRIWTRNYSGFLDGELRASAPAGARVTSLDTLEAVVEVLASLTTAESLEKTLLSTPHQTVRDLTEVINKKMKWVDDYRAGNYSRETLGFNGNSGSPTLSMEQERTMFEKRNRIWLEVLSHNFTYDSAFVGVGVGHLIGKEGLLSLLHQNGFAIRKMNPPPLATESCEKALSELPPSPLNQLKQFFQSFTKR